MQLSHLRRLIQKRHGKGESYQKIADSYKITKPMAYQIAHGYRPGKRIAAILGLDPEPKLKYTRTRERRLNEVAQAHGYPTWCAYETAILRGK